MQITVHHYKMYMARKIVRLIMLQLSSTPKMAKYISLHFECTFGSKKSVEKNAMNIQYNNLLLIIIIIFLFSKELHVLTSIPCNDSTMFSETNIAACDSEPRQYLPSMP